MTDGPRLIGRKEAADYCGIGESTFSMWVATDKMPPPIPGTRKWDKRAIDAKLDETSGLTTPAPQAISPDPDKEFRDWQKKQEERDRFRPKLNLGAKWERVIRFMIDHPDCATVDLIPQAAEPTMSQMTKLGLIQPAGKDDKGRRKYYLTDFARNEIKLLDTWLNWKF